MAGSQGYTAALRKKREAGVGITNADQFIGDLETNARALPGAMYRSAVGLPENVLSLGSTMLSQAGTGLGVGAAMLVDKLRGKKPDWDAAGDVINERVQEQTYQPRMPESQELQGALGSAMEPLDRGMRKAGEVAADVTGSPAVGAGVYTGLNMLDPEHLAPVAGTVKALRGAGRVARSVESAPVRNAGTFGQAGAWTLGDIKDTEGHFDFRSPTLEAFDRLKKQEQGRISGQQLRKALVREGAKKQEITEMGLDDVLNSPDLMEAADVKRLAQEQAPSFARTTNRATHPDENAILEKAKELADNSGDYQYPYSITRNGEHVEHADTSYDARDRIQQLMDEAVEWTANSNLENITDLMDPETLAGMDEEARRQWAYESAVEDVRDNDDWQFDRDTTQEPLNRQDVYDNYLSQVRGDPAYWGLGASTPKYGQYTMGFGSHHEPGPEHNYAVNMMKLTGEDRFGRGRITAEGLRPYMHAEYAKSQGIPVAAEDAEAIGPKPSRAFEVEALRRTKREADPNNEKYRAPFKGSHYTDYGVNPIFFSRETDRAAPAWGSVQAGAGVTPEAQYLRTTSNDVPQPPMGDMPTRQLEEQQSDAYQAGRRRGFREPGPKMDAAMAAHAEALRSGTPKQHQLLSQIQDVLQAPDMAEYIKNVMEGSVSRAVGVREALRVYSDAMTNPGLTYADRFERGRLLLQELYYNAPGHLSEMSDTLREKFEDYKTREKTPLEFATPSGPLKETEQFMSASLGDSLMRAVQEGQQYLTWAKGDVHAKRYGTDSIQFAAETGNPRRIRYAAHQNTKGNSDSLTMPLLDKIQAGAERLEQNNFPDVLDLDDPNIDEKLQAIVRKNLTYGFDNFHEKGKAIEARAALIKKEMEKVAAAAVTAKPGQVSAGHYSPRGVGYDSAYSGNRDRIIALLRRAGVQDKDLPKFHEDALTGEYGESLGREGFEIDPEVARAAKRGFYYPY